MTAVGWARISPMLACRAPGAPRKCASLRRVRKHRADLRLGDCVPVDLGLAVEAPYPAAVADLANMIMDLIAGQHRLAEFCTVNCHEIHKLGAVVLPEA